MAAKMVARGVRVSALCPFESALTSAMRALGVDVVIVPIADSPSWPAMRTATAYIDGERVDVVRTHLGDADVLGALAAALTGRRCIATIHARSINMLELEALRLHDGMHALISSGVAALQARAVGIDDSRVHVIRPAVDTASTACSGVLHDILGVPRETTIVGGAGDLAHDSAADVFVRAAALVAGRMHDVHFAWIGAGPQRSALEALAAALGLSPRFHLIGAREDTRDLLASLDVFVHPTVAAELPIEVLEAMAAARPVVAGRTGVLPELVTHGCSGVLVDAERPCALAEAIVTLLHDVERRHALGEGARRNAIAHHSLDEAADRLVELLARVASTTAHSSTSDAAPPIRVTVPRIR